MLSQIAACVAGIVDRVVFNWRLYTLLATVFAAFLYYLNSVGYTEWLLLTYYTALTRRVNVPKNKAPKQFAPSISFMGGGHLWMFAIGVGHHIYENYEIDKIKFLASSCGTFAACPLACGLDPYDWCKKDWGKCISHFNSRLLGCLFDSKHFYLKLWDEYLPEDAHIRVSGRLFLSVTRVPSMKNLVISHFESREKLLQCLVASMCLPFAFIRDFPVYIDGIGYCVDGGFSNDAPCLDSYTVTASALHREADIKPSKGPLDKPVQWNKWLKWSRTYSSFNEMFESDDETDEDNGKGGKKIRHSSNSGDDDCISSSSSDVGSSEHYNDDGSIDYDHKSRIRAIDIIRVPEYSRVWQVASMGERSASKCEDFGRHEWQIIRKNKSGTATSNCSGRQSEPIVGSNSSSYSSSYSSSSSSCSVAVNDMRMINGVQTKKADEFKKND
jgi:hypothetical protein